MNEWNIYLKEYQWLKDSQWAAPSVTDSNAVIVARIQKGWIWKGRL